MTTSRTLLSVGLALVVSFCTATSAAALVDLAAVADSDVAVERGARLGADERARLASTASSLVERGTPVKFVVLREKPEDGQAYADSLRRKLSFTGDVLVLSPRSLRISSPLRTADVQAVFEAERATLRSDPVDGVIAIARRLAALRAAPAAPASGDPSGEGGGGSGAGALLGLLLLGGGAVAVAAVVARRRARTRSSASAVVRRDALEPLVDGLAAQIGDLDDDMQIAGERTSAAREHYDVAVLSYGEARDLLGAPAAGDASTEAAAAALEGGLRAARRTRAVLEGRSPEAADGEPLLEGLCAFDPKHGRATTTVTITTSRGEGAELPACASCAADMDAGTEPRFREVHERGRMVPYWQTSGWGGRGGGGGMGPIVGGVLGGLILGGVLDGSSAEASQGDGGDDFGGGGGGDFGGGGGGDFGGGGGGDFGGGGGGDF